MSNIKQTVGHECKLYYMSGGTFGSPTWTVIGAAKDVNTNITRAEIECAKRLSGEMHYRGGMKAFEINFTLAYMATDSASEAVRDAIINGTSIVLGAFTAAYNAVGAEGPKMKAELFTFNRSEAINGPVEIQVTAKPTGEEDTTWVEVAA